MTNTNNKSNDKLLATAYGEKLYISDLGNILEDSKSTSDSVFIVNQFLDSWLMDKILFQNAQNNITNKDEINQLVDNYKTSLMIHHLEKQISSESTKNIPEAEIDTFYSQNQDQYILEQDHIITLFLRVPKSIYNDTTKTLWKTEDLPALKQLAIDYNLSAYLDLNAWIQSSQLEKLLPEEIVKKISYKNNSSYSLEEDNHVFLIKILDVKKKGENAPLFLVKDEIQEKLSYQNAKTFLKKWKKDLYKNNIQSKSIIINSENPLIIE